ncbi:hypothetical protein ES332_D06G139900v1 [Gossypium tomentosum]|uniref:Uncharacterized protein n=1 Tax=Gossypium tomentosum TaxID=34277 RepID=A0A5D2KHN7_GOSTO|nr:hypothetical protein ES332_D06G139900v1 [Gossypium tomentosum]
MLSTFSTMTYKPSMFLSLTESPIVMPLVHRTQYSFTPTLIMTQTPLRSLSYQSGSSQTPTPRSEDAQWQSRRNQSQSIIDKGKEGERPVPQLVTKVQPRRNPTCNHL